jgi:hypothetical protein
MSNTIFQKLTTDMEVYLEAMAAWSKSSMFTLVALSLERTQMASKSFKWKLIRIMASTKPVCQRKVTSDKKQVH